MGRERVVCDTLAREPGERLGVLLGQPLGAVLPATWHWAYFNPAVAPGDVGHDGHERLGLFLPPAPFERRMWAGGVVEVVRGPGDPVPEGYQVVADTTLVAYSAITQNGHRIHWDRAFCRDVEGYPGLVVHGPLLATLLAETLVEDPEPCRFTYRAAAPVFETSPFRVVRDGPSARIERSDGAVAMTAEVG